MPSHPPTCSANSPIFVDAKRQALFKHYAIAFLKATLMEDAEAKAIFAGTANAD